MKRCNGCGAEMNDTDRFCPQCGEKAEGGQKNAGHGEDGRMVDEVNNLVPLM